MNSPKNWNRTKLKISFWSVCVIIFATVGLLALKRGVKNRDARIRQEAHPPVAWTTNGTVVTAEGWDAANNCMARWSRNSDPKAQVFYQWTRLPEYISFNSIQDGEVSDIEDLKKANSTLEAAANINSKTIGMYKEICAHLEVENAALKKRVDELESGKWRVDASATNYTITQNDLRNAIESVYPPPKYRVVTNLNGGTLTHYPDKTNNIVLNP